MKIKNIEILGYGTIKETRMDISDLTVFIGKNGSGKSFVLESLFHFFSEFNYIGGGVASASTDYLWFNRDSYKPIKISLFLEFTEGEIKTIMPSGQLQITTLKEKFNGKFPIYIARTIDISTGWHTELIKIGDIEFVKGDRPSTADEINKQLVPSFELRKYTYYLFSPGASRRHLVGEKVLVDHTNNMAYLGSPQVDSLAARGIVKISSEGAGKNWREWIQTKGITISERVPTSNDVPELQLFTQESIQGFLTNLTNSMRNKFRLIPAVRDVKGTGARQSFLEPTIVQTLTSLANSTSRADELRWNDFRNHVEWFMNSKNLEPNPGQILVRDSDLRLPTPNLGGGEQAILGLVYSLTEKNVIFGLEEPESHLHADLVRKFSTFIKDLAKENQIFLVTHSPLLVDRSNIGNNWLVTRNGKESKVKKLEHKEDFALVLHELGVFPSDIYLSNAVVFVEGGTEKEAVFPIFAEKLGLKLDDKIAVISLGGAGKLKDNLRIWLNIVKHAPIDYFVLLDKDAESLAFEIIKKLDIQKERFYVLQKGSIEDYYPDALVVQSLKDIFGVQISIDDIKGKMPKDKTIEKILQGQKKLVSSWKILIGEDIAKKMSGNIIPEEIGSLVEKLKPLAS